MAKKIRRKKDNNNTFKALLFFLLTIILTLFIYKNSPGKIGRISSTDEPRNSLQLNQYNPLAKSPESDKNPKPIPDSPEKQCMIKNGDLVTSSELTDLGCSCVGHAFTDYEAACCDAPVDLEHVDITHPGPGWKELIGDIPEGAKYWCDAKPIIYLYPQIPTYIEVKVEVPGKVVVSDPLYPPQGWKNILANPDGNLNYQGKHYKNLFYEASITPIEPPRDGIVIPTSLLTNTLDNFVTKMGLIGNEKNDFLSFWIPKLEKINSAYIHISAFTSEEKQTIDKVLITPRPDTFIEFIMYFKPLKNPISVDSFAFPIVPQRKGFTAVEWGGIIDN